MFPAPDRVYGPALGRTGTTVAVDENTTDSESEPALFVAVYVIVLD